jgi:hypothetical protein
MARSSERIRTRRSDLAEAHRPGDGIDVMAWAAPSGPATLEDDLLDESCAMVRYAFGSGLSVPPTVVRSIDASLALRRKGHGPLGNGEAVHETLKESWASEAMLTRLLAAHQHLTRIVAPATPRTILLFASADRRSRLSFLGPVRLVRHMLVAATICLVAFILLATSPEVDQTSGNVFNSSGTSLLVNLLFYLAAAGIGASFAALFTAYRYVATTTYDPKYESSYWMRFILGLIAGVILPALVPVASQGNASDMTRPLLALLGGFSASFVYRLLDRLVQTAESLVRGDPRDAVAIREESAMLRNSQELARHRLGLAHALAELQSRMGQEADPEELRSDLNHILAALLSGVEGPTELVLDAEAIPPEAASTAGKPRLSPTPPAAPGPKSVNANP